uniref:NADH dehydrogenase subunit 6 n=1 Tax=Bochrus foveatus TaxID=2969364 RepID=UPI002176CCC0|nr:NADH dehydrogenase subunit 6 [Bochrus foveatus]UUJ37722.1 NADH dehydrogenase subunit 6 [Bochrus foveatus]
MLLLNLMMLNSFLFMFSIHPLMMAIMIVIQSLLVAMMMGMMMSSFWFSYIMVIIMISGMLVLFIYMASMSSNEMMTMSMKKILMSLMLMIFMSLLYNHMETFYMLSNNYLNITLNMLFNTKTMIITIIMVIYLFFTMISVSKIVNVNEGPLRTLK